jgi:hypothetical protein
MYESVEFSCITGIVAQIHVVIRFLNARNVIAAEIPYHPVEVCRENVMSGQSVAKLCAEFQGGRGQRMERQTHKSKNY